MTSLYGLRENNIGRPISELSSKDRAGNKCPVPFARNWPFGCFAQMVPDTYFPLIAEAIEMPDRSEPIDAARCVYGFSFQPMSIPTAKHQHAATSGFSRAYSFIIVSRSLAGSAT